MVPFVVGAALACVTKGALKDIFILCTVIWGGSTLSFLAGVRRGLSFRTESGPTVMQIASMFVLFVLALLSIVSAVLGKMIIAIGLLLAGYILIFILDPRAAKTGEAPLFFARLRPPQIGIAICSLAVLMVVIL
jgi:hypothetical protein